MNREIDRPLALVTGATSGIGRSIAERLAQKGYDLWIMGRREARLIELKERFERQFSVAVTVDRVDFSELSELKLTLEARRNLWEKLSVVVQSAGLALGTQGLDRARFEDSETMLAVNVRAFLLIHHCLLPSLKNRPYADILHIGSVAGRWVYPGGGVYCATKHAVRALTEGLRMDLMGSNVRVMNIEPGMVETEFSEVRLGDPSAAKRVYEGMRPLVAEDIAECAMWMLSRPRHVSIQEIVVFPTDQGGVGHVHRS